MSVIGTISYRCFVVGIANAYHSEIIISLARRKFSIFMSNETISKLSTMKILNKLIHSQVILPTCCFFFRCVFASLPFLSGQLLAHSQTRLRRRRLDEHSKKEKRDRVYSWIERADDDDDDGETRRFENKFTFHWAHFFRQICDCVLLALVSWIFKPQAWQTSV